MKQIGYLLSILLVLTPAATFAAGQKIDNDAAKIEKAKRNIAKLGVGSKAKVTVTRDDGSKVKGYVYSAGDEDFVIRDRKTDVPTTVKYTEVKSIDDERGHRNAKLAALFVGLGAAITLAAVFGSIAANER